MKKRSKNLNALIVFAKEPKEGKVKTRLLRQFSPSTVTKLYKAFVSDVLKMALNAKCDERFIYYTGGNSQDSFLNHYRKHFLLKRQRGNDLGARMLAAFKSSYNQGLANVVIVGTDCLSVTTQDIEKAFSKLTKYDCVLGPSLDGGYYLIGLRTPHPELFSNIQWSTKNVFDETLRKLKKLNMSVYLLKKREDIDTPDSLIKFIKSPVKHAGPSFSATLKFIQANSEFQCYKK